MIKEEWKNLWHSLWFKIVILAIMVIPMIYACVFLGSMWDPYGNAGDIPVAVVNEDKSVTYDGKTLSVGSDLAKKLEDSDAMNFNVVSASTAKKGLAKGDYYMIITIPSNFSKNATTLLDDSPSSMILTYTTNPQTNYIATKMDDSAMTKLKAQVSSTVTKTYAKTVFGKIKTLSNGFKTASNGSSKINKGVNSAKTGNATITKNLKKLASSSLVFTDGVDTMAKGLSSYTSGVSSVYAGTSKLASNSAALNKGVSQLESGSSELLAKVKEASSSLSSGISSSASDIEKLETGNETISTSAKTLSSYITALEKSKTDNKLVETSSATATALKTKATECKTNADALKTQAANLKSVMDQETDKTTTLYQTQTTLYNTMISYATTLDTLNTQLTSVSALLSGDASAMDSSSKINANVQTLLTNTQTLSANNNSAITKLVTNLKTIQAGFTGTSTTTGLVDGVSQINSGLSTLKTSTATYTAGVDQVNSGLKKLTSNNKTLTSGMSQIKSGATQIAGGSSKLASGSSELGTGLVKISDGTSALTSSLAKAANKSNIKTTDSTYKQMSSPVTTTKKETTTIKNNGHAMAPYMMSVALYVACMAFGLMYPLLKNLTQAKSGIRYYFAKASVMFPVAICQALILIVALTQINNFQPAQFAGCLAFTMLVSCAFMSMITWVSMAFGKVGEFLALIFMVFNLGGSAGTYPLETSSAFYKAIHNFVPFTYSVHGFRTVIANATQFPTEDVIFFSLYLIGFAIATIVLINIRRKTGGKLLIPHAFEGENM